MSNIVKLNGVNPYFIKIRLFPFSLRDRIASWFKSLPYGSISNWEEMVEAFTNRFFPPALTYEKRREIITFK